MTKALPPDHIIRLRGPWSCAHSSLSAPRQIVYPPTRHELKELADLSPPLVFTRPFHRPTNLTPSHRVTLSVREAHAVRQITVNSVSSEQCEVKLPCVDVAWNITDLLQLRNLVILHVDSSLIAASDDPWFGLVALHIRLLGR